MGIWQKADKGIAMIEKRDELNMKYYYSSREARTHFVLRIVPVPGFSLWEVVLFSLSLFLTKLSQLMPSDRTRTPQTQCMAKYCS